MRLPASTSGHKRFCLNTKCMVPQGQGMLPLCCRQRCVNVYCARKCNCICRSAEKHPPRGQFAKPDGPRRAKKRPAQAEEALRRLREQRSARRRSSDDASDSQSSQADEDQTDGAESSDSETDVDAWPVRPQRLLQIPDSEDQEQAQVPLLGAGELAGLDRVDEHPEQSHGHDAGNPSEASPAHNTPGAGRHHGHQGSTGAQERRSSAPATDSKQSKSVIDLRDEAGDALTSSPEAPSDNPALASEACQQSQPFIVRLHLLVPGSGSVAADGRVEAMQASPPKQQGTVPRQDRVKEAGSAEGPSPSAVQEGPPQSAQMNARTRRELHLLRPFGWDKCGCLRPTGSALHSGASFGDHMRR